MKCKVCGRTQEELEDEFGTDVEIQDHQGITKCSKCIREYEVETETSDEKDPEDVGDWKEEVIA